MAKKEWADKTEQEEGAEEAQSAREDAAKVTGRGAKNEREMRNNELAKAESPKKTRRSILYGKDD